MGFADRQPADGVSGKIQIDERVRVLAAQRRVRAALHDAEKHLPRGVAVAARNNRASGAPNRACARPLRARGIPPQGASMHSSSTMMMSAPSAISISSAFSGERKCSEPSRCERNVTPSSATLRRLAQAENLKAARIGEDRARPGHESVQAAHVANQLVPGTQIEMVGIRENDLRAEVFEILLRLAFYRCGGAHGHEGGRFDHAVRSGQAAEARAGRIGRKNFELKTHPAKCIRRTRGGDTGSARHDKQPKAENRARMPCQKESLLVVQLRLKPMASRIMSQKDEDVNGDAQRP